MELTRSQIVEITSRMVNKSAISTSDEPFLYMITRVVFTSISIQRRNKTTFEFADLNININGWRLEIAKEIYTLFKYGIWGETLTNYSDSLYINIKCGKDTISLENGKLIILRSIKNEVI